MIFLKSNQEIEIMRRAGKIVGEVLLRLEEELKPGITTGDLDRLAEELIRKAGAVPTFIGYQGYPKSLCTSINEEVVHGIPGPKVINDGDIIGIDCAVTFEGYVADHAKSFAVGAVSKEETDLIDRTRQALMTGIEAFQLGNRIGDIGAAIESFATPYEYGVVRDFVGHGIGRKMHEEPQVPNFGRPGTGARIKTGMVIAIEPMFNLGTHEVEVLQDGWTVVTKDGKKAAHFEHTIAMTEKGPEIITKI
ncbi:MAG: type I methionyl aminopeptidase [Deltaproteobacteria bacterium]|nr:type I methionyl aminopeptidase [Deltaproteobacteria bacterium]